MRNSFEHIVSAAAFRETGDLDAGTLSYITKGGTWVLASKGIYNDDGRPHDLVAVLQDGSVLPLRPTVNPELVQQLTDAFRTP